MKAKRIIKNIFLILMAFFLILLFQNLGILGKRIIYTSKANFVAFNKTIFLSCLIIIPIIIYRNILFKKKLYFCVTILFLLLCNLFEGLYLGFNAFIFIIIYIYLLTMTFYMILKTKYSFEISMVYGFSIILLSSFIIGMFGGLIILKYILLLFGFYMIYYIYKKYKTDETEVIDSLNKMFSSGFVIFNILFIISIMFGVGMYVHIYDEYSHWAYDAKAMIYYSKFGTSQDIMLRTRNYAPIFTVWHYIVAIFDGFNESYLYIGLNILVFIYLLPAFYYFKNNNILVKFLGLISIVFGCYLFGGVYSYNTLYVDYAITAIFAATILIYFISKDKKLNLSKVLIVLFSILTLSKPNGFVIGFISLLIIFINEIIDFNVNSIKKFLKSIVIFLKKYKFYILAIVLTFLIWKIYLYITGKITTDYYDFTILPNSLKSDLKYKLNYDFIVNFVKKIVLSFNNDCFSGKIPLAFFHYLLVSVIIIYTLFYKLTNDFKKAILKIIPFIISYFAFFFLTILSIFVAMSNYEASILASFERYLGWYNAAIVIFIIFMVLRLKDDKNIVFKLIILTYIVISIPFSTMTGFVKNPIKSESYNLSVERAKKVKLINKYTEKDSMIYVIDQEDKDGIMAMWYSRYYTFPRKTNASSSAINWKIKTKLNEDDLSDWGFTAEQWAKHLKEYKFDYVFLYSADKYFFENTKFMCDDYEKAKKSVLFKIEINNESLKLVPIK